MALNLCTTNMEIVFRIWAILEFEFVENIDAGKLHNLF